MEDMEKCFGQKLYDLKRDKFGIALTSDGQFRRELAISEIPKNDVSN